MDSLETATQNFFSWTVNEALDMNRRQLIMSSAAYGLAPFAAAAASEPRAAPATGSNTEQRGGAADSLPVPPHGSIPVAFLISEGAVVIDFCGPWEVFESVSASGRRDPAFTLYTVAASWSAHACPTGACRF